MPPDKTIEKGSKVRVHYTGKLRDGSVFDSSRGREPLEFTQGAGMLIPGFEAAVAGHVAGDIVNVAILPAEAYGERDASLVFTVPRAQVPSHVPLEVGTLLQLSSEKGDMNVSITAVGADDITLDGNPPLAGQELLFEIEIIDVQ
ncbi:MAG: peptidylprolyl isomerase [Desulfovibrio sp.]|nr:peptidylprolyl isomerase [Desulfovibrio sp.]